MRIDILTTFPDLFAMSGHSPVGSSIIGRARDAGLVELVTTNIRDHALNKHVKTDDRPFGGGPGMVMSCQPLWDATMHAESLDAAPARRVLLSPQGRPLTQELARQLAGEPRLLLICGHYEGIDQRVIDRLDPLEISLGDYILSSGELAAMVLIDALTRLLPGVLGHGESAAQDSFVPAPTTDPDGSPIDTKRRTKWMKELGITGREKLLDCPHYTRPRVWEVDGDAVEVPEVLLSGDHTAVARWRLEQMVERTRKQRPDLLTSR